MHTYLWVFHLRKPFPTPAVTMLQLANQTLPRSALLKAICHPPPSTRSQSPSTISLSHTLHAPLRPLIPAGAAGQRETGQEISALSWLSMNDFKAKHRSYLLEISWSCTACVGKLVPAFYPVTCRILVQQKIQDHIHQSLLHRACRGSLPAARARERITQHLQPLL